MTKKWIPKLEFRDPKLLTPYARNTKKHPDDQIDKIAGQIAANGFTQPIVVDKKGVVIAGHGRLEAAKKLNLSKVPIVVADHLSETQVKAYRIADNKVAQSEWDLDNLRFEMGSLHTKDFDMALTGFDLDEIDHFLKEPEKEQQGGGPGSDGKKGNVSQITLVFDPEDFDKIMTKVMVLREELLAKSNTEFFLKLLKFYEENA